MATTQITDYITSDMLLELRRKAGEVSGNNYSDSQLTAYLARYPLIDVNGRQWYLDPQYMTGSGSTAQPTVLLNPVWIPTFDVNSAAADVWQEKAASLVNNYDFSAEGASYSRSQMYEHAMAQARYFRGRRAPSFQRATVWPLVNNATAMFDDIIDRNDHN